MLKPQNSAQPSSQVFTPGMPTNEVVPMVLEQSGRGERAFDIFSRLLRERIIFLGTEVDDSLANVIMSQLLFLEAEDQSKLQYAVLLFLLLP